MTTDAMLEHAANYLLNHCFVLGSVEDQRADYLYIQDHLDQVRAVFAPLGYRVVLYPAPLQARCSGERARGQPGQIVEIREHTTFSTAFALPAKARKPGYRCRTGAGDGGGGTGRSCKK